MPNLRLVGCDIKMVNFKEIEAKWQKNWQDNKIFEANPDPNREKFFLTVAYPYPNSPQHIGHARTYTLTDSYARFKRMQGLNVLYPQGFHYTGTPILAMANRIAENDQELIDTFEEIYKVPSDVITTFKNDPLAVANYFHNEIREGMKKIGFSIDWRREFTTIDPPYMKFIEWQFHTLHKGGYVTKGSHPVGWCPLDQNAVGQHEQNEQRAHVPSRKPASGNQPFEGKQKQENQRGKGKGKIVGIGVIYKEEISTHPANGPDEKEQGSPGQSQESGLCPCRVHHR